jgi:hypothetical protein
MASYRDMLSLMADAAGTMQELKKPFLFAETGYQGENEDNPGNERDIAGLLLFQQVWAGFMLGGCGSGKNWWWDVYIHPNNLWRHYTGFSRVVAKLDWRDRALAPLPAGDGDIRVYGWRSPRQALIWPVPAADTWYRAVVAGKPRPAFRQDVILRLGGFEPRARYAIHHLDMHSGDEIESRQTGADTTGVMSATVPSGSLDRVLWIERKR